jgi:hypothetical protein
MDVLRLGKKVRRVTVLEHNASNGQVTPVVLFRGGKKNRKTTRMSRPLERTIRRWADAHSEMADTYLSRHNKSTRKRRDGWVRDLNLNLTRAGRKGFKRLRVKRWLDF